MDAVIRAYSRLESLKSNLPETSVREKYVQEYHEIIDSLAALKNANFDEFKIPANELQARQIAKLRGNIKYSSNRYVERAFLLAKLDALLSYFFIAYLQEDKPEYGFRIPGK